MGLTGKVAIVTGASRGIGRAIAERLGDRGASGVVNYAGSRDKALEVVRDTEMFASAAPPEMKQMAAQMSPLGRMGQPGDVADVVVFVCSEEARWLTGQSIHATGGAV